MPRPVHFEIHASDPAATEAFYETVFGWSFVKWGDMPYWMVMTGDGDPNAGTPDTEPGINGGMIPRHGPKPEEGQPVNSWVVTVDVPDCQEYVDRAVRAGATVALPRMATPGVGWLAYVKDPDGNILGLMEMDPTAA